MARSSDGEVEVFELVDGLLVRRGGALAVTGEGHVTLDDKEAHERREGDGRAEREHDDGVEELLAEDTEVGGNQGGGHGGGELRHGHQAGAEGLAAIKPGGAQGQPATADLTGDQTEDGGAGQQPAANDIHIAVRHTEEGLEVGLEAEAEEEEGDDEAETDGLELVMDTILGVTEARRTRHGDARDEGAHDEVDTDHFAEEDHQEDHQDKEGGLGLVRLRHHPLHDTPEQRHHEHDGGQEEDNHAQEGRREPRAKGGGIDMLKQRNALHQSHAATGRGRRHRVQLNADGQGDEREDVRDDGGRKNRHAEARLHQAKFAQHGEDDTNVVRGEERGIDHRRNNPGASFRGEKPVNEEARQRGQQIGEDGERGHGLALVRQQTQIRLHAGQRHQEDKSQEAKRLHHVIERSRGGLGGRQPDRCPIRNDVKEVKATRSNNDTRDHQRHHRGHMDAPRHDLNHRDQCNQRQKGNQIGQLTHDTRSLSNPCQFCPLFPFPFPTLRTNERHPLLCPERFLREDASAREARWANAGRFAG